MLTSCFIDEWVAQNHHGYSTQQNFYSLHEAEIRSHLPILKVLLSNEGNGTGLEKAQPASSLLTHLFSIALSPPRTEL